MQTQTYPQREFLSLTLLKTKKHFCLCFCRWIWPFFPPPPRYLQRCLLLLSIRKRYGQGSARPPRCGAGGQTPLPVGLQPLLPVCWALVYWGAGLGSMPQLWGYKPCHRGDGTMPRWGPWARRGGKCRMGWACRGAQSHDRLLFAGCGAGNVGFPRRSAALVLFTGAWAGCSPGQPLASALPKSLFITGKWPDHFFVPVTRLQRDARLPALAGVGRAKHQREIPWPFCNVS